MFKVSTYFTLVITPGGKKGGRNPSEVDVFKHTGPVSPPLLAGESNKSRVDISTYAPNTLNLPARNPREIHKAAIWWYLSTSEKGIEDATANPVESVSSSEITVPGYPPTHTWYVHMVFHGESGYSPARPTPSDIHPHLAKS